MVKLFKLLRRVIIHKFWVAYYCFQLGLYWQGITHDFSKFSLTEVRGALKYWHDSKSSLAYEKDIILCANNDVLIRIRLGEKVIAEYPIHCDVTDNEVLISEYANAKSDQRREE